MLFHENKYTNFNEQNSFFYIDYIFNTIDKVIHISKINIFIDILHEIVNNNKFAVIHKIKKFYFVDVLFIVVIVIVVKN